MSAQFSLLISFQRIQRTLERIALRADGCQFPQQLVVLVEERHETPLSTFRSSADSVLAASFGTVSQDDNSIAPGKKGRARLASTTRPQIPRCRFADGVSLEKYLGLKSQSAGPITDQGLS
jgi:hypothetical protein